MYTTFCSFLYLFNGKYIEPDYGGSKNGLKGGCCSCIISKLLYLNQTYFFTHIHITNKKILIQTNTTD